MTSRRLIRIKVLQLLYSYTKKEGMTLAEIERDLVKSVNKSSELYYHTFLLLTEIQRKAFLKIDAIKNRRFTSVEVPPLDSRFAENPVLIAIANNKKFQTFNSSNFISWSNEMEIVGYFYNALVASELYKTYMSKEEVTFDDHKDFVLKFFAELIAQDDIFFQTLEEKDIYWNDDFELVLELVYKTIKNTSESSNEDSNIFLPIFHMDEDMEFARKLLRKTLLEREEYLKIIDKFTHNWEIERISEIDKLIMCVAISELKHFPSIPVKVTLDEFIEISKSYSSPKSGSFINGVLDKIVTLLKESGEITKIGRGLVE